MRRNLLLLLVSLLFCYTAESQIKKTIVSSADKANAATQFNMKKVEVTPLQATVLDEQTSATHSQLKKVIRHHTANEKNEMSMERVSATLVLKPHEEASKEMPVKINRVIAGDKKAGATTKQHVVVPRLTAKKIDN